MKCFIVLAVIALIGCSFVEGRAIRDTKEDLLKLGKDLLAKADEEIKKLSADPKQAHEVTVLKTEEAKIQKLVEDLTAATDALKIEKIEHDLKAAESKLDAEIKKVEIKDDKADAAKEELLKKAVSLEADAAKLVKKLTTEKKDDLAAALQKDEDQLKTLIKELEDAKTPADLTKIEKELADLEKRITAEMKKDDPTTGPTTKKPTIDQKDALLKKATTLEKTASDLIAKLKTDKKDADAAEVQKDEDAVKKLVAELQGATPADFTKIEQELDTAEKNLAAAIKKDQAAPATNAPTTAAPAGPTTAAPAAPTTAAALPVPSTAKV